MNYYRRYVGDYLRDTARLSMLEHGAYTLLLDYYYAEERPIPLDLDEVYRMVRALIPEERRAVVKVLTTFFQKKEDGYHQKRVVKEIATSKQARENGGKGGRPKTEDVTGDVTGIETGAVTGKITGRKTGNGGESGHPPTTNHQPPTTKPPTTSAKKPLSAAARRSNGAAVDTSSAWKAYRNAYLERYGVEPTPNAEDNAHMLAFVKKVPAEDAPHVAVFYVGHNKAWYVGKQHAVKCLREDAVGLHVQWRSRRRVTDTEARQADRTSATAEQVNRLLDEAGAQ